MDPLTHTLLGACSGYAVSGRRLGRRAAAIGALAAFVPDADVFIRSAVDPLLAIEHHRGFTHSLPFAPVGAAIVAALWLWPRDRRPPALACWGCAVLAYVTHCLLDAATSYGTQLLWPFSRHRFGWDFISIIDPPFTLVLALGLVVALRRQRRRAAIIALSFAAAYLGFGGLQHARALNAQRELAASRGHPVERAEAMPTLGNNLVWRGLYVSEGWIHSDRIRIGWCSGPEVREGWSLPRVTAADLTGPERTRNGRSAFERFAWFSDGWVARSPDRPDVLGDMRYSLSTAAFDPIWGIRFTAPDAPTEVVWVNQSRDRDVNLGELWREIIGDDPRYRRLGPAD